MKYKKKRRKRKGDDDLCKGLANFVCRGPGSKYFQYLGLP